MNFVFPLYLRAPKGVVSVTANFPTENLPKNYFLFCLFNYNFLTSFYAASNHANPLANLASICPLTRTQPSSAPHTRVTYGSQGLGTVAASHAGSQHRCSYQPHRITWDVIKFYVRRLT